MQTNESALQLTADPLPAEGDRLRVRLKGVGGDPSSYRFACASQCPDDLTLDQDTGIASWDRQAASLFTPTFLVTDGASTSHTVLNITINITNNAAPSASACTYEGQNNCLVGQGFAVVDATKLTPGNVRTGVTLGGVSGGYPSASHPLASGTLLADLPSLDPNVAAGPYEFWKSDGERVQATVLPPRAPLIEESLRTSLSDSFLVRYGYNASWATLDANTACPFTANGWEVVLSPSRIWCSLVTRAISLKDNAVQVRLQSASTSTGPGDADSVVGLSIYGTPDPNSGHAPMIEFKIWKDTMGFVLVASRETRTSSNAFVGGSLVVMKTGTEPLSFPLTLRMHHDSSDGKVWFSTSSDGVQWTTFHSATIPNFDPRSGKAQTLVYQSNPSDLAVTLTDFVVKARP